MISVWGYKNSECQISPCFPRDGLFFFYTDLGIGERWGEGKKKKKRETKKYCGLIAGTNGT